MATTFVSGVAGFLGSHLADALLAEGHEVRGCDNLVGGYRENVPTHVEFFQVDCEDLSSIREATRGVDVVYHAACLPYEGLSVFAPYMAAKSTYEATASLLSASLSNGVRRFVYFSSMARYGAQERLPFTEDMDPKPQDPYGISKLASEMLLCNLAETHGMEWVILVPHNIIGPRQKFDDPYRNVASIMVNLMLQGRQPFIYGDGSQKRCFSYVGDILPCLVRAGFYQAVVSNVLNVGPDEEFVSINELARISAELLGFDLKPIYLAGRPQEVKYANCSANRARQLLGFRTQTSLREGVLSIIEYIRAKGPKGFVYHLELELHSLGVPPTWRDRLF